jgi:hypothetical protein
MALAKKEKFKFQLFGEVEVDCYIKIKRITGDKNNLLMDVVFTKDNAQGEFVHSFSCSFAPSLDGANFIKQGYEHLKTLPEFAGAKDC